MKFTNDHDFFASSEFSFSQITETGRFFDKVQQVNHITMASFGYQSLGLIPFGLIFSSSHLA